MGKEKEAKRYVIGFLGAFVLLAVLRNVTNLWPYSVLFCFYMISQIGCALIVSCWMLTVRSRIIEPKLRRLMLLSGGMLVLYFFMQMVRYGLFPDAPGICRYMWYGYYIPMTFIPLTAADLVRELSVPEGKRADRRWKLLLIPAVLLCLGFLTNDLHQLAFGLPNGLDAGDRGADAGPDLLPVRPVYGGADRTDRVQSAVSAATDQK